MGRLISCPRRPVSDPNVKLPPQGETSQEIAGENLNHGVVVSAHGPEKEIMVWSSGFYNMYVYVFQLETQKSVGYSSLPWWEPFGGVWKLLQDS